MEAVTRVTAIQQTVYTVNGTGQRHQFDAIIVDVRIAQSPQNLR